MIQPAQPANPERLAKRNILDTILAHKREVEVPACKQALPLAALRRDAETAPPTRDFAAALHPAGGHVALIAEIKRASPSKGLLAKGMFEPVTLARDYASSGAACISVLTDERFFQGSLAHLRAVRAVADIPLLRKDFVVDAYQLFEARAAGADAILLIVAALSDVELQDLHGLARELTLTPLVEVHDEAETERALRLGAQVIGVNNRDLRTFVTDIDTTRSCVRVIDGHALAPGGTAPGEGHPSCKTAGPTLSVVSESGIFTAHDVRRVAAMGANAVLVGESIITSGDIAGQVRALSRVPRF